MWKPPIRKQHYCWIASVLINETEKTYYLQILSICICFGNIDTYIDERNKEKGERIVPKPNDPPLLAIPAIILCFIITLNLGHYKAIDLILPIIIVVQ